MIDWAVPWTADAVITALYLAVATTVVVSVPLVYALNADLRDSLARAILAGTGATALAFLTMLTVTIGYHAGLDLPDHTWHWMQRFIYASVALGKMTLLLALIRVLREKKALGILIKRGERNGE